MITENPNQLLYVSSPSTPPPPSLHPTPQATLITFSVFTQVPIFNIFPYR